MQESPSWGDEGRLWQSWRVNSCGTDKMHDSHCCLPGPWGLPLSNPFWFVLYPGLGHPTLLPGGWGRDGKWLHIFIVTTFLVSRLQWRIDFLYTAGTLEHLIVLYHGWYHNYSGYSLSLLHSCALRSLRCFDLHELILTTPLIKSWWELSLWEWDLEFAIRGG